MPDPTQDLLAQLLQQRTGAIPSTAPPNPIKPPTAAAFGTSPAETAISGQLATNPFALNFAVGARGRQRAGENRFLGALLQTNQQAGDLSREQGRGAADLKLTTELIKQIAQPGVLSALNQRGGLRGLFPRSTGGPIEAARLSGVQGKAAADLGSAVQRGAAGGLRLDPTSETQRGAGVEAREVTPTSVAASRIGKLGKVEGFSKGSKFTIDFGGSPELLPLFLQVLADRGINTQAVASGETQPQTTGEVSREQLDELKAAEFAADRNGLEEIDRSDLPDGSITRTYRDPDTGKTQKFTFPKEGGSSHVDVSPFEIN